MQLKNLILQDNTIKIVLVLISLTILLQYLNIGSISIFISSAISLVFISKLIGTATEELAKHTGMTLGALLNLTFGNITELVILFFALKAGLIDVVKAAITGSIIANLLFTLGISIFLGGIKHKSLRFNTENASMNGTLLTLAIITLAIPTGFSFQAADSINLQTNIERISLVSAMILFGIYLCSILFSVYTHKHLFVERIEKEIPVWSVRRAVFILFAATIAGAYTSELLVGSLMPFAQTFDLTDTFIGVILLGLIGNVTEQGASISAAMKNKMDISLGISAGSSSQIALFVSPILLFLSFPLGNPMTLVFSSMELIAIFASVLIYNIIATDGKFEWFEGVVFLGIYILFGYVFLLIP
ncbi:MAG TPA: calcium/proton exchanger [candidate division Zixibacteria bacterium]|nr:calcium/proton exchanger [candidate division Zixibacteria bacterium]